MNNIIMNLKLFFKRRFRAVIYIGFVVLTVALCIYSIVWSYEYIDSGYGVILLELETIIEKSIYVFVIFLFLAYDYFSQIKVARAEELIQTSKTGLMKIGIFQFVNMIILSIIISVVYIICFIIHSIVLDAVYSEYIGYGILAIFYYIFLVGIMGSLIGWLISHINKRVLAIACCIGVTYFVMILKQDITFMYDATMYKITDMFYVFCRNVSSNVAYYYLYPADIFVLTKIMMWITFFLISVFVVYARGKKRIAVTAFYIIPIILLGVNLMPHSQYHPNNCMDYSDVSSWLYDQMYYYAPDEKFNVEEAAYSITDYNIDLKIDYLLKAVVSLKVDNKNLEEYNMTLYHGYKIDSITNQNLEELEYERDGDFIKIRRGNYSVDSIILNYKGKSAMFYSNRQGAFLPGFFAYYPQAGFKRIFFYDYIKYNIALSDKPANYDVTIHNNKQMYSNLEEVDKNHFKGNSDNLTLISGFVKEENIEGIDIIYPYLDDRDNPIYNDKFRGLMIDVVNNNPPGDAIDYNLKNKKLIVTPCMNGEFDLLGMDCTFVSTSFLETTYPEYRRSGEFYDCTKWTIFKEE